MDELLNKRLLELKKLAADRQLPQAEVLSALDEAARLAPDDPEIPYLMALNLQRGFYPNENEVQFRTKMERAFELARSGYSSWSLPIVVACFKRGHEELARALIRRATTEDCRGQASRHYHKALLLSNYGDDPAGVRQAIDAALAIEIHPATLSWRGRLLGASGDVEAARADFDALARLTPEDANAFLQRGRFRRKIGELASAAEDFERALTLRPPDPALEFVFAAHYHSFDVCLELADGLLDGGKPEAAIKACDQAMGFSSASRCLAAWHRSFAKEKAGDLDGAIRDVGIAIEAPGLKIKAQWRLDALLTASTKLGPQP